MEKDMVTLGLYFEITDSEMYGGRGTVGYASVTIELTIENLNEMDVCKYAEEQRKNFAKMHGVEADKVKVIPRPDYEENVDE